MERLQVAYTYLQAGDWPAAHEIVQADKSSLANWMHAVVHLLEGDESNADYWFRQAGKTGCSVDRVQAELEKIKLVIEGK
jgi:Tfp pilus assembly protein PilF